MMKQRILTWLKNLEAQSKKLKKQLKEQPKISSVNKCNRRIAKIDDGLLSATIDTKGRDVVITIKGFDSWAKAYDWATLQSVQWKTEQLDRQESYSFKTNITPKKTFH